MTIVDKETKARLSQILKYNKPIGIGRGYRLSDEKKQEILELYFSEGLGFRSIGCKLNVSRSTARRHVLIEKERIEE